MKRLISLFVLLAGLSGGSGLAQAEECLKIASVSTTKGGLTHYVTGLRKSFKIAGLCMDLSFMPVKRIQKQIRKGLLDGEFVRGEDYLKAMQGVVIKVPTPLLEAKGYIVTLKSGNFHPKGLSDVGDKIIGVVHGVAWHDAIVHKLKRPHKRINFLTLFKLLKAGRIDGLLVDGSIIDRGVTLGFLKRNVIHLSEPIADLSAYFLLHKKNRKYVGQLDKAIKQVKSEKGFIP